MQRSSQMLMRLNVETRGYHAEADAHWLELMAPHVSKQQYVEQLTRLYGFEAPLESALAYTPKFSFVIDLKKRKTSGLIAQDLLALGMTPSKIAQLPYLTISPFEDHAHALGWLYVRERSTLLHSAIKAHVLTRLPGGDKATSYLSAYGEDVADLWLELGTVLDRVAQSGPKAIEQILDGATEAFYELRRWLSRGELRASNA